MHFKRPELKIQFLKRLHFRTRQLAFKFDVWCRESKLGHAVITDISRDLDWYGKNKLTEPAFSWHWVDCAVDFRNSHLTETQKDMCRVWFLEQCRGSEWELVLRDHGTGSHWHVAYKCFAARKQFNKPPKVQ